MKRIPTPVTATSEERALVQKLARMVRAGRTDEAADTLASHLQGAYDNGYRDAAADYERAWGWGGAS